MMEERTYRHESTGSKSGGRPHRSSHSHSARVTSMTSRVASAPVTVLVSSQHFGLH